MPATRKTQRNKRKSSTQASRGLKPAPELVSQLIDRVNSLPPDIEPPDINSIYEKAKQEAIAEGKDLNDINQHIDLMSQTLSYCTKDLPDAFKKYFVIYDPDFSAIDDTELIIHELERDVDFYRSTIETRNLLRWISRVSNLDFLDRVFEDAPSVDSFREIWIDEKGIIQFEDSLARVLEGVEATRIKECAICRRFFWAGRITQQCCSTACAHALRNRRYRAKYKDYLIRRHTKEHQAVQEDSKRSSSKKSKRNPKKGKKG